MSNQYGKIPLISGQQILEDVGGTGLSGIVIGNESGLTCSVTLQGANVKKTLYPGTVDKFLVPKGRSWNGTVQIDPTSDLNNVISWPSSHVYIDTYGINENIEGQYPFVLNRAGNVGNAVNFVSGSATSVQNDNNAAGTQVVEMSVLGSPTANDIHFNDGSGWMGRWINPIFTKTFQWFSAGATALQLGATGLLTEVLGSFKVDGTTELVGNTTIDGNAVVTGTLGVTGIETGGTINATTIGVTTENATTLNVTTVNASGNIIEANAQAMQWKDNGGSARNVFQVDANNNTQIFGIAGLNLIQMLSSAGALGFIFDLVNKSVDIKTTAVNLAGNTNGSATLYQFLTGTNVKAAILLLSAYRNAGALGQVINLPVPFNTWALWVVGAGTNIVPRLGGSNLVNMCRVTTALAVGGGTNAASTPIPPTSFGEIVQGFDAFDLGNSQASNHSTVLFLIGQ